MTIKQIVFNYIDLAGIIHNSDSNISPINNLIPTSGKCIKLGIQAPKDTIFKMIPYNTTNNYDSTKANTFIIGPSEVYELTECEIGFLAFEDSEIKNTIIDMILQ